LRRPFHSLDDQPSRSSSESGGSPDIHITLSGIGTALATASISAGSVMQGFPSL